MLLNFKDYQSKPIIRKAHEITDKDELLFNAELSQLTINGETVACFQEPKIGDYIVFLNDTDIYHCSKSVFEDRNVV